VYQVQIRHSTQNEKMRKVVGRAGLEHPPLALSKTPISGEGGAKSDARRTPKHIKHPEIDTPNLPPDLAEIVALWPELPEYFKAAIKALVQTYRDGGSDESEQ